MKTLLLLLFSGSFNLSAQMTNAEVYNFDVGDVHQTKISVNGAEPHEYQLDTIVDKIIGVDSITYTIHRKTFLNDPPSYPSSSSVETLVITNLASYPSHFNYTSCLPIWEGTIPGLCSEGVDLNESVSDATCFEAPYWYSLLHRGLGGPYYRVLDLPNMIDYESVLIYSNSTQWGECGNYFDISVGIEELTTETRKVIRIVDLLGRDVPFSSNTLLIYIYDDGSSQKVFRVE